MKEIPVKCCSFNSNIEYIYKNKMGKQLKLVIHWEKKTLKSVNAWDTGKNDKAYVTYK